MNTNKIEEKLHIVQDDLRVWIARTFCNTGEVNKKTHS